MIIEGVNLLNDVERPVTPPFHYCRTLEIITDKGPVYAPYKTTNRSEFTARSGIPLLKTLPSDITNDFRLLDENTIDGFLKTSNSINKKILTIKQFNNITPGSKLRITILQPAGNVLSSWDSKQKTDFADTQAEYYQAKLGSDLITYPFLDLPTSEYIEFIDKRYNAIEPQSTIFTLDMKMNHNSLKQILDHLQKKNKPMIVALIHRKWIDTVTQHRLINSYFDNPKLVFMACQVERTDEEISNTHSVSIGSNFDIVALKQARGYSKNEDLNLSNIKFLSPQTLKIENLPNTFQQQRDLISEIGITTEDYLDYTHLSQILRGRRGAACHPKKYQILYYFAKFHEAITSAIIFDKERTMIQEQSIGEHILNTNLQHIPMFRHNNV